MFLTHNAPASRLRLTEITSGSPISMWRLRSTTRIAVSNGGQRNVRGEGSYTQFIITIYILLQRQKYCICNNKNERYHSQLVKSVSKDIYIFSRAYSDKTLKTTRTHDSRSRTRLPIDIRLLLSTLHV